MNIDFCVFSLSLSLSLPRILRKPKLSIKAAFSSCHSVFILASAHYFLHGIRVRGLRTSLQPIQREEEQEERWIEAWRARFQSRSSTEPTTRLGPTRCTNTCLDTVTGVMSKERMTWHPHLNTEIFRHENTRRAGYYTVSRLVWANNY